MTLLRSDAEVEQLAGYIESLPPTGLLGIDTETGAPAHLEAYDKDASLKPYAGAFCTGISVCPIESEDELPVDPRNRPEGFYVPVGHRFGNASERAVRRLCEAISRTQAAHVLHHATFDWAILENLDKGFKPSRRTIDTQVVRWLLDENQPKALKVNAEMYLGEDAAREQRELKAKLAPAVRGVMKTKDGPGNYAAVRAAFPEWPAAMAKRFAKEMARSRTWSHLTPEEMAPYAALDPVLTVQLGDYLIGYQELLEPKAALRREMELQPIVYGMTRRGVSSSVEKLEAAGKMYAERAETIRDELDAEFGIGGRRFNPGSSNQVADLLYGKLGLPVLVRTDMGAPSTNKSALSMLAGHPVAAKILDYRRWSKASSAYCLPLVDLLKRSPDGRLHTHFSTVGTVTGRLAASFPNLMTIPKPNVLPEVREAFYETPPGVERIGFDLASAELWVTAHMTGDKYLIETLQSGGDMHTDLAVMTFGEVTPALRALAKNVNYSMAYEAGVGPLTLYCAQAGMDPESALKMAYKLKDSHEALFPQMHAVSKALTAKAEDIGYLPLHVKGRYRHFKSPGKIIPYYTALNALVQGGIAEYMKDVMLEVERRGYGELLVLQVHDELVFDAPLQNGKSMKEELQQLLDSINDDINPFRFKLSWDGKPWASE